MRDLRVPVDTREARYALAAVAITLFGLLSMHGWGSHTGAHSMEASPPRADVMIAAGGVAGGVAGHGRSKSAAGELDAFAPVGAGHSAGLDSDEPGESGAGMVGLCLALLAGLVLGTAFLLARRGIRFPRALLPAWHLPVFIGRDRGPPGLSELCVIRC